MPVLQRVTTWHKVTRPPAPTIWLATLSLTSKSHMRDAMRNADIVHERLIVARNAA
jgi:hypothetical protein